MDAPAHDQETGGYGWGASACGVCMEARGVNAWCADCHGTALWPENLPSASLYLDCETQWQRAPMTGMPLGLHYPSVDIVMRRHGYPPELFGDIQLLEREYLRIWAETAKPRNQS